MEVAGGMTRSSLSGDKDRLWRLALDDPGQVRRNLPYVAGRRVKPEVVYPVQGEVVFERQIGAVNQVFDRVIDSSFVAVRH